MKLYVLDELAAAEPEPPAPQVRRRSRLLVVGGAMAVLLGVGWLLLGQVRGDTRAVSGQPIAAVEVAPPVTASTAPTITLSTQQHGRQAAGALSGGTDADSAPVEASSIVRKGDKILVELHAVDIGSALAMMSQATRTRVIGADVLRGDPARLTAKLTATSPQAAWQSVFGNVANFALSCAGEACVVHIVSALASGQRQASASVSVSENVPQDVGVLGPDVQSSEASLAAAVAALQRQQTTYTEDY